MEWLDLPPVWLAILVALVWVSPWMLPWGPAPRVGAILLLVAGGLVLAALHAFRMARTTIIPRQDPSALITGGIFRWTRNPIYLADLLILLGFALLWGRVLGLLFMPLLFLVLDRRFIRGEERKLQMTYGETYDRYRETTRRWV